MRTSKTKAKFIIFKLKFIIYFLLVVVILLSIILVYLGLTDPKITTEKCEPINTGIIGDTMGGIMGPLIAVGVAYLTFIAFWVQYKANRQQRKDIRFERFENKFYELLRLHKENVNEVRKINKEHIVKEGRQLFNTMFREFEFCYKLILAVNKNKNGDNSAQDKYFIKMAYNLLYFGVGQGAMNILNKTYYNDVVAKDVIERLQKCQESYYNNNASNFAEIKAPIPDGDPLILLTDIPPFHGYIIGHYYRHLYQTVKYVEAQTFLDEEQKYSYVRTLRVQLTDYEQVMLYYNVISDFGNEWLLEDEKNKYCMLVRYKIIHNAPVPLLELAPDLSPYKHYILSKEITDWERVNKGKEFFEWNE